VRKARLVITTPVAAGGASFAILLATYLATAAPDLTFWDASEFVTAAHTFGIPHPPGTPLWVMLARVFSLALESAGPVRSITLLSVTSGAAAGAIGAAMAARWVGGRGAVAAAVSAGTMFTVWNNATEVEVYAASLLASVCMLYAGDRAGRPDTADAQRIRWRLLVAFIAGVSLPLHLSAVVALPAAIVLAWRGNRISAFQFAGLLGVAALGASSVFVMLFRAQHNPSLNSGNPETFQALIDVLQRKQYAVAGLFPRRAPLWLQLGNVFQWADWQVAYGLFPEVGPGWRRTPLTLLWAWLGLLGLRAAWLHERRVGRALAVLAISGTIGVAIWLNLRTGPSFGAGVLPEGALHEARERDYFFALGFWCWGILAGMGLARIATSLARRIPRLFTVPVFAVAALPLVVNREVVDRSKEPNATLPRTIARLMLDAVPVNGVLIVGGDNDTFPIWYLQQVEHYRPDVQAVSAPLLGARWYRDELAVFRVVPPAFALEWHGQQATLAAIRAAAQTRDRSVRVSVLVDADARRAVDIDAGWLLEGLVYSPTTRIPAGATGLDLGALGRAREAVPPSSLRTLGKGTSRVTETMQELLRCTQVRELTDPLLVGRCNGG